jgi:hypothetical protein
MVGGYFKRNSIGFGSAGGGIFTKPETGEDGVGLADTGGEPSTQAEGCSFSTNEKKLHGTFDEELIRAKTKQPYARGD